MSDLVKSSGRIHWVGTGLSTGSGLAVLCSRASEVAVWGRTIDRAAGLLARLGLTGRATTHAYDPDRLAAALRPGDIVVSMLPAAQHAHVLDQCLRRSAHFACSSYTWAELAEMAESTVRAGIVVLTEAGLDPGLDHVLAHLLVDRARTVLGDGRAVVSFSSYCGGVPAAPNQFRYRFSWAPAGVLNALRSPARYIEDGVEQTVGLPWMATTRLVLGDELFEVYPNRDSVPFVRQYGFPPTWEVERFVRGTLRLNGWRDAWSGVFDVLRAGDDAQVTALAHDLANRYPVSEHDRDRVVLTVRLTVRTTGGRSWSGEYLLDVVGDEHENAMARCVSLPLAYGVLRILDGLTPPGPRRAAEDQVEAREWLTFLGKHGMECVSRDVPMQLEMGGS